MATYSTSAKGMKQRDIYEKNVTLTSAQMLALNATPVTLLTAPGAGKSIVIVGIYASKAAGTGYTAAANADIAFKYTDSSGAVAATMETTGFLTSASAVQAYAPATAGTYFPVANAPIVAHMLNSEVTGGNSPVQFKILYKVFTVPAF